MSNIRVVSIRGLRRRLEELLGSDSPLFRSFDEAFATEDEDAMQMAMDCLGQYPEKVRKDVEAVLLNWLFDPEDASGLLDLPAASPSHH